MFVYKYLSRQSKVSRESTVLFKRECNECVKKKKKAKSMLISVKHELKWLNLEM